jgi:hypothetical protein
MVLREDLLAQLKEEVDKFEGTEVENFCASETGSLLLFQWKLLTNIAKIVEPTERVEAEICWILSERNILETLLCSGYVHDHKWLDTIQYLRSILDLDPEAHSGYRLRLAVAIAITFSTPVKSLASPDLCIDGRKRYQNFVKWAEDGKLFPNFFTLTTWQMRYVVGSWAQDEELEWSRENVLCECKSPEKIGDATHKMVKYKDKNENGISVHESSKYYNYRPVTMAVLHEVGAVCGGVSKFGSAMAQAFGVPAMPVGQPGHCAFLWWRNGEWILSNDISGINKSTMHQGIQWTWTSQASFVHLMEDAQKDMDKYKMSEKLRIASKFCLQENALEILGRSLDVCPENYLVWRDIAAQHGNPNPGLRRGAWLGKCLDSFEKENRKSKIISRNKAVTVSSLQDRGQNLVDETGSEWWSEEETAWIEIDLGCEYQVDSLDIQWWGSSVSRNFSIFASLGEDFEQVKHNNDAFENPDGLNSYSRFTGWNEPTRFVKFLLKEGSLDPWGMKKYFGIRQINMRGKKKRQNKLLCSENLDTISRNSSKSNIDIDLQEICLVDHVKLTSKNDISDTKVHLEASMDGIVWRNLSTEKTETEDQSMTVSISCLASYLRVAWETNNTNTFDHIRVFGTELSPTEILVTRAKQDLAKHPCIERYICDMLNTAQYKNISHGMLCKASDCQERASNILDGTSSEWWTESESAWIEIDLGHICKVHKVDIQWWGTSISSSYTVLAGVVDDMLGQVRCQQDEMESPEGYNGWSKLPGWEEKTRFIRINLENGSLDPWGLKKYFGIIQVIVTGKNY